MRGPGRAFAKWSTGLVLWSSLVMLASNCSQDHDAEGPRDAVTIHLRNAVLTENVGGWAISCNFDLVNETGSALEVETHYSSVFDSMAVALVDENGKELLRRGFADHLSPYSLDTRKFHFPVGTTSKCVTFSIGSIPSESKKLRVRLTSAVLVRGRGKRVTSNLVELQQVQE